VGGDTAARHRVDARRPVVSAPTTLVDELFAHALRLGVEPGYWDVKGNWHDASVDAVLAVLTSMGAPVAKLEDAAGPLRNHVLELATRPLEPVVTVVGSAPLRFEVCLPVERGPLTLRVELFFESGQRISWDLIVGTLTALRATEADGRSWIVREVDLELDSASIGYHDLIVSWGSQRHEATVIIAPEYVVQPSATERMWGVFAPLYSLRTGRGVGTNMYDLDAVGEWIGQHGGKVIATLPLLASFLDRPFDPSPYSPVSRRFWNEAYLDVERLPEFASSAAAVSRLADPSTRSEIAALSAQKGFDAGRQWKLVSGFLDELTSTFFSQPAQEREAFDRWIAETPDVIAYARFRAAAERHGTGWSAWPEPQRMGRLESSDYDHRVAARHVYAQWSMHRQVGDVSRAMEARGQHLYLDLPVGASPEGFDTWIDQDAYGWGCSVGAPPDDFFGAGQNWGFPPLRPDVSRDSGHRHLIECLRHHMSHAGMLRLDHVMGLHRLFWVPAGMKPSEGVYVRAATEEQFAVVAVESHRSGCLVIGEDLGTVPDEVRDSMDRHRVLRSYVAEFVLPTGPGVPMGEPDHRMVASIDTHDTPTFAAFCIGEDIRMRHEAGFLDADQFDLAMRNRRHAGEGLSTALDLGGYLVRAGDEGALLRCLLEFLADSDAPAVLISLDDLRGEIEPQNIPGTPSDRPNWVLRMPGPLQDLVDDPWVEAVLKVVQRRRLASHGRARNDRESSGEPQ